MTTMYILIIWLKDEKKEDKKEEKKVEKKKESSSEEESSEEESSEEESSDEEEETKKDTKSEAKKVEKKVRNCYFYHIFILVYLAYCQNVLSFYFTQKVYYSNTLLFVSNSILQ